KTLPTRKGLHQLLGPPATEQEPGQLRTNMLITGLWCQPCHVVKDGLFLLEHIQPLRQKTQRHQGTGLPLPRNEVTTDGTQQRGLTRTVAPHQAIRSGPRTNNSSPQGRPWPRHSPLNRSTSRPEGTVVSGRSTQISESLRTASAASC